MLSSVACPAVQYFSTLPHKRGAAVAQWLRCCATNRKVDGSIPAGVNGFFIDIKFFRPLYGPGADSTSNINEYQEYFLGGKGGRCVRPTTYHHSVPLSRNLGALTFWNPLGLFRPVMGLLYFLPHKRHDFRKKNLLKVKYVFWFTLQICLKHF